MAHLSNSIIIDKEKYYFGAAFNLLKPHKLNEVIKLPEGWELVLNSQSHYLILRGNQYKGDMRTFPAYCYETIQKGLDLLSINGKADISIESGSEEYCIWWKNEKQFLRVVRMTDFKMAASFEMDVIDQDGNRIDTKTEKNTQYHESLRYYRLSQVTEDLFDSFRNMYLAFESLLSLRTKIRRGEKEGEWLKRALNNLPYLRSLENMFEQRKLNVVEKFYKQIYLDVRCNLFHSKNNAKKLIPQNLKDRRKVSESLQILTQIVLMLSDELLKIERETAIITNVGFSKMLDDKFKSEILLSDSEKKVSIYESFKDDIHQSSFSFNADYSEVLSVSGISYYVGSLNTLNFRGVPIINRFAFKLDEEIFSVHRIMGLTLEDIDEIEFHLGYRLKNANLPKINFQY